MQAQELSQLGFDVRLCQIALELNGDNPEAAMGWILDHGDSYRDEHPEAFTDEAEMDAAASEEVEASESYIGDSRYSVEDFDDRTLEGNSTDSLRRYTMASEDFSPFRMEGTGGISSARQRVEVVRLSPWLRICDAGLDGKDSVSDINGM